MILTTSETYSKMTEEKKPGKKPKYSGNGVAVWVNHDKEGRERLDIKIVGHEYITAFNQEDYKHE